MEGRGHVAGGGRLGDGSLPVVNFEANVFATFRCHCAPPYLRSVGILSSLLLEMGCFRTNCVSVDTCCPCPANSDPLLAANYIPSATVSPKSRNPKRLLC